ncbi:hypothetical protein AAK899_00250 [Erysipelotrichaceae bacterium 51-3]
MIFIGSIFMVWIFILSHQLLHPVLKRPGQMFLCLLTILIFTTSAWWSRFSPLWMVLVLGSGYFCFGFQDSLFARITVLFLGTVIWIVLYMLAIALMVLGSDVLIPGFLIQQSLLVGTILSVLCLVCLRPIRSLLHLILASSFSKPDWILWIPAVLLSMLTVWSAFSTKQGGMDTILVVLMLAIVWILLAFHLNHVLNREIQIRENELSKRLDLLRRNYELEFSYLHEQIHDYSHLYTLAMQAGHFDLAKAIDHDSQKLQKLFAQVSCSSWILSAVLVEHQNQIQDLDIQISTTMIDPDLPALATSMVYQLYEAALQSGLQALACSPKRALVFRQNKENGSTVFIMSCSASAQMPDLCFLPNECKVEFLSGKDRSKLKVIFPTSNTPQKIS